VFQFWGCERSGSGGNIINPIASARLRTANHFGFTYGKVEARAKLPAGSKILGLQVKSNKVVSAPSCRKVSPGRESPAKDLEWQKTVKRVIRANF
jgi:hypothetical protein